MCSSDLKEFAAKSDRPADVKGVMLKPLKRERGTDSVKYSAVSIEYSRDERVATITLRGPDAAPPKSADEMVAQGAEFWPLRLARELDDAILDLRINELDTAVIVFKSEGDPEQVIAYDKFLEANAKHWLAREVMLKWKRVLKRVDLTSRSIVALVEPGSCFAGTLAEITFACDRSYMFSGTMKGDNRPAATLDLSVLNFGRYPMSNALTRLQTRFLGEPDSVEKAKAQK